MKNVTEAIRAISSGTRGYNTGGHTYYAQRTNKTVQKVNSIMVTLPAKSTNRKYIGALLNGVPEYMVGAGVAEKLSTKA
jgi:hypothetical protein